MGKLLKEFVQTSDKETALIELRRLQIDNATVNVDDRQMGITWTAPKSSISIARTDTGITSWAQFELLLGEQRATVNLNGILIRRGEELSLTFGFTDVSPLQITGLSRKFETLRYFDAPVTGSVALDLQQMVSQTQLTLIWRRMPANFMFPIPLKRK